MIMSWTDGEGVTYWADSDAKAYKKYLQDKQDKVGKAAPPVAVAKPEAEAKRK